MLKKLRIRFVLINMAIVTIMLGLIFSVMYVSTANNLKEASLQMMRSLAMQPMHSAPIENQDDEMRLPYFTIYLNQEGDITDTDGTFYDLSNEELLDKVLAQTTGSDADTGVLAAYHLRYLHADTPKGECYVFSDLTSERAILQGLIRTLLIIAALAFLAFLGISILLARWAVKPVERAWQQQKQFVADASHELKTPLTVITTDAELLKAGDGSEAESRQLVGSILTESGQMRGLVESMLELARLDNGTVKGAKTVVDLSDEIGNAAMTFEPVFFEKGLTFTYDIEPGLTLYGNAVQFKQLADIFLDNAAKYASPGGGVALTLKALSAKKLLLTVANEGDPIAPEDQKNLFKRFYRADKARTQNHSYGLGLSIAEKIVHDYRGRIWVESKNGINRFSVELPKS